MLGMVLLKGLRFHALGEGMNCHVVRMTSLNYLFTPCLWVLDIISSQQLDQINVHKLTLPINIRMKNNRKIKLCIHPFLECCPKHAKKLESQSNTIILCKPKCIHTIAKNKSKVSCLVMVLLQGISTSCWTNLQPQINSCGLSWTLANLQQNPQIYFPKVYLVLIMLSTS